MPERELMGELRKMASHQDHAAASASDDRWRMRMVEAFSYTTLHDYLSLMEEIDYRMEQSRKAGDDDEDMINTLAMIGWQYVTNELTYQATQEQEYNDGV